MIRCALVLLAACSGSGDGVRRGDDPTGPGASSADTDGDAGGGTDTTPPGDTGTAPLDPFVPGLNVVVDGVVFGDGGAIDLGSARLGYGAVSTEVLFANPTEAPITLSGDPRDWISGDAAIGWDAPPPTVVAPGATAAAWLSLAPVAEGVARATLDLPADTGPLTLELHGRIDPALRWIIVGRLGRTLISDDYGLSWPYDVQEVQGEEEWWHDRNLEEVVYAEGRFVAAGGANVGRFATSLDGTAWTDTHTGDGIVNALAWGDGQFVAESGGDLWWSEDGILWVEEAFSWRNGLSELVYGGDRFVGVGGARRAVTLDGRTWEADADHPGELSTLAYGAGVFVAVGNAGLISTTTDGITWSDVTVGTANRGGVVWTGTTFVTGGWPDGALFSPDGAQWTEVFGNELITPQGYANGRFVGWSWRDRIWESSDGVDWTLTLDDSYPEQAGYTGMALGLEP